MKLTLAALTAAVLSPLPAHAAKEVFAHVIVGNVPAFTLSDWTSDMELARAALIDGFVLNIAPQDPSTLPSVALAFEAAEPLNFTLFFSFDYLAQGPWPADAVTALLQKHTPSQAYFKPDGKRPLVSTFEGPGSAGDWPAIKAATDALFVPDWGSIAPAEAVTLAGGVADGLFTFDAWPEGDANMTVDGDRAVQEALKGREGGGGVYMMPVSPWFFTNLPGFNKNWLWRGDELWDVRWAQVMEVQPDFVQILTWNDYGESHYIGPVIEKELGLFESAKAPVNYVRGVSHDGWRKFLPFYVQLYKTGQVPAQIEEGVAAYYRTAPALACPSGGTSGNDEGHGEVEVPPEQLMEDSVFYSALLNSDEGVTVTVSIGGKEQTGGFNRVPAAGAGTPGVYMGSVPFGGSTGEVVVTVSRGGQEVGKAEGGKGISTQCENNVQNWNAVAV